MSCSALLFSVQVKSGILILLYKTLTKRREDTENEQNEAREPYAGSQIFADYLGDLFADRYAAAAPDRRNCILHFDFSILSGKIGSGISASLRQEALSLENAIDNLDFASKQFALDGQIVEEMSSFLLEKQIYRKSQIMSSINQKINLVNFTNPYIGLTAYIMPGSDDPVLFTNMSARRNFDISTLPSFMRYNGADYYGPHGTMYAVGDNVVFSEQRIVRVSGQHQLYIYLETNYSLLRKIFKQEAYGMKVNHLLVNQSGTLTHVIDGKLPGKIVKAAGNLRGFRMRSWTATICSDTRVRRAGSWWLS